MIHLALITTFNRLGLLNQCIESIKKTTPDTQIVVIDDGSDENTKEYLTEADLEIVISSKSNCGLAPSLDTGIYAIRNWVRFRKAEGVINDHEEVFVSYIQDDVVFTKDRWPEYCLEQSKNVCMSPLYKGIGFITGHVAPEHVNSSVIVKSITSSSKFFFRDHIRATHLMANLGYWITHFPISEYGESGAIRGHPGPVNGSDVDWWLLRGHPKSVLKQGKTNLVVPGILKHLGSDQSTWQDKVLPEVC